MWSVDRGPSLIRMSVSNFSHFRHLHQTLIHGSHGGHLESLQLLSAPEHKSDGVETQWKASGQYGDLELLPY